MTLDDAKKLVATMTPGQITRKFAKEYAKSPSGLFHAHRLVEKAARAKSLSEQGPRIKAKVEEILKQYPHMNIHAAYGAAGRALGIL